MGFACRVVGTADVEVVGAEAGGGVDAARACIQGDVVAAQNHTVPVKEGMPGSHQFKFPALEGGQYLAGGIVDVGGFTDVLGQVLG